MTKMVLERGKLSKRNGTWIIKWSNGEELDTRDASTFKRNTIEQWWEKEISKWIEVDMDKVVHKENLKQYWFRDWRDEKEYLTNAYSIKDLKKRMGTDRIQVLKTYYNVKNLKDDGVKWLY